MACVVFTGRYEHTIDAKNRLAIPSDIRKRLRRGAEQADADVVLYVTLDESRKRLCIWPEDKFDQRAEELDRSERGPQEMLPYERVFFSMATATELDGQGRVRLPDDLMQMSGVSGEVTILGVKDHLEVWNRADWTSYLQSMLAENPMVLMNPRQALRNEPKQQP